MSRGVKMDKRQILSTISDKGRYAIVRALLEYEQLNVSELMALTKLKQANTSRHLKILYQKGIIVKKRKQHYIYYSIKKDFLSSNIQLIKYLVV